MTMGHYIAQRPSVTISAMRAGSAAYVELGLAMSSESSAAAPLVDAALVRRLLNRQAPQWSGLPVRQVLPGGWDNRTFRLGDALCVRLPSAERYAAQAGKEHRWLPVLAPQLSVEIPQSLMLGEPDEDFPWPWSVRRWIAGAPPDAATAPHGLAESLAAFLSGLQGISTMGGPVAGTHSFFRGGDLGVYQDETLGALTALQGRLDTEHARRIWDRACASRWQEEPVWVHGDIAPDNLLVQDGELTAVIDFGCMAIGDPACDYAIAWTYFDADSRAEFRARLGADGNTWARARGWALWKALITVASLEGNASAAERSWRTIDAILQYAED